MWNQLSSEQKKAYGEDYYEAAMTSVEKYSRQVSPFSLKETQLELHSI